MCEFFADCVLLDMGGSVDPFFFLFFLEVAPASCCTFDIGIDACKRLY